MRIHDTASTDMAQLNAAVADDPALASPLLRALEAAGDNPEGVAAIVDAGIEALIAAGGVLPVPSLPISATREKYSDNRKGFAPHDAMVFAVTLDREISVRNLLIEQSGQVDAELLMSDWGNRIDFEAMAPGESQAILLLDSKNIAYNRNCAEAGARTTQQEDLEAAGLVFGDDVQATIVCTALVKKANEAVARLTGEERDLLTKLKTGVIRPRSGFLYVHDDGRLRADYFDGHRLADCWAFGGRPPAE